MMNQDSFDQCIRIWPYGQSPYQYLNGYCLPEDILPDGERIVIFGPAETIPGESNTVPSKSIMATIDRIRDGKPSVCCAEGDGPAGPGTVYTVVL